MVLREDRTIFPSSLHTLDFFLSLSDIWVLFNEADIRGFSGAIGVVDLLLVCSSFVLFISLLDTDPIGLLLSFLECLLFLLLSITFLGSTVCFRFLPDLDVDSN